MEIEKKTNLTIGDLALPTVFLIILLALFGPMIILGAMEGIEEGAKALEFCNQEGYEHAEHYTSGTIYCRTSRIIIDCHHIMCIKNYDVNKATYWDGIKQRY